MTANVDLSVLIVEPNGSLYWPYEFLSDYYTITRVRTVKLALNNLDAVNPDLVFLSASFSIEQSLVFFESLKNFTSVDLIPVVMVVDMAHRMNRIPGLSWGGKIAVIDAGITESELYSTIGRVFK